MMNHGQECFAFHECERDLEGADMEVQREIVMRRLREQHHFAAGNVSSKMAEWEIVPHDGPLIVVERDWDEIEASVRLSLIERGLKEMEADMEVIKSDFEKFMDFHPHALFIGFEDLFKIDTMVKIWKHCVPQLIVPLARFKELLRHNISLSVEAGMPTI